MPCCENLHLKINMTTTLLCTFSVVVCRFSKCHLHISLFVCMYFSSLISAFKFFIHPLILYLRELYPHCYLKTNIQIKQECLLNIAM